MKQSNSSFFLKAYELDRADDAQALSAMYALLAATLGLISIIGFVLVNARSHDVPGWLIALAPLAPDSVHGFSSTAFL